MTAQAAVAQHPFRLRILRSGFFAFGAYFLISSLVTAFFHLLGPEAFYDAIVNMGLLRGAPLIILSFLAPAASRHPSGWSRLTFTAVGALLLIVGWSTILLSGGHPDSFPPLDGVAFVSTLTGLIAFYPSAIANIVGALRVYAQEWRERHSGTTTSPPPISR